MPSPKIITKILINKNPFKKIINIPNQIQNYKLKFKTSKLQYLQICNNPNKNFINQFLLKKIFNRNKNEFEKIVLDCFFSFSENILKLIDIKIYNGIVTTLNIFQLGASYELLEKIKILNKEIIVISPFASGKLDSLYNNLEDDDKNFINSLKKKYDEDLQGLNLIYLNSISNIKFIILGTKNYTRFKSIISKNKIKKKLTKNEINLISKIQEQFG